MTAALRLAGASVQVAGRELWSDLSVTVNAGEFICVLGPNGVGKSTLVKVVLGLIPLAAGQLEVLGRAPKEVRDQIGYLPQRRHFDSSVRVRGVDIVRLGLDGARWGLPLPSWLPPRAAARRAATRVAEVIELVGAGEFARRPIGELSGGEQQRLLIGQALIARPRILLLDEPLDSLDLPHQRAIGELVGQIARLEHVAVVMVAHDINPIVDSLDRVIYLAGGSALVGSPEEVLTTTTLSRLYQAPVEVLRAADGRLVVVGAPEPHARHSDRQ